MHRPESTDQVVLTLRRQFSRDPTNGFSDFFKTHPSALRYSGGRPELQTQSGVCRGRPCACPKEATEAAHTRGAPGCFGLRRSSRQMPCFPQTEEVIRCPTRHHGYGCECPIGTHSLAHSLYHNRAPRLQLWLSLSWGEADTASARRNPRASETRHANCESLVRFTSDIPLPNRHPLIDRRCEQH